MAERDLAMPPPDPTTRSPASASPALELLYEPASQKQAFVEACAWAEDIFLCLSWIEPGDAQGPSYADLRSHEDKVRQAIVGLSHLQSYPALLRRLYRASVLRLVGTLDGSFSPNCYLFLRGARARVILASAPFSSTRFARSCESFVVFEGDRDDPFTLRAFGLLERCRASAHVPTRAELDAYEDAWAAVRTGGRPPEAIAGLPLIPHDSAALGELELEVDPSAVLDAFVKVRASLSAAAAVRVPARLVPHGAGWGDTAHSTTLYWSSLGLWGALHRSGPRYGLHFGFVPPWEVERPAATLSLVAERAPVSLAEQDAAASHDTMAIARAEDGRRFLVHLAVDDRDPTTDVQVRDASGSSRATLVGEVGAADFVQTAAAFALRLSRRRAHHEAELSS